MWLSPGPGPSSLLSPAAPFPYNKKLAGRREEGRACSQPFPRERSTTKKQAVKEQERYLFCDWFSGIRKGWEKGTERRLQNPNRKMDNKINYILLFFYSNFVVVFVLLPSLQQFHNQNINTNYLFVYLFVVPKLLFSFPFLFYYPFLFHHCSTNKKGWIKKEGLGKENRQEKPTIKLNGIINKKR